ncbi:hypothetical protein [Streptomyces sp. NBC_00687]|uniref:hypothetical protein n=1 Tax=Streptomyces sp. NBC_00687 TaxID=2975807 RepID=UPI002B1D3022|nr:hypothetical protein [Streptomyces sp. NBC_00687]
MVWDLSASGGGVTVDEGVGAQLAQDPGHDLTRAQRAQHLVQVAGRGDAVLCERGQRLVAQGL